MTARRANREEFAIEATISEVETGSGKFFTLILRDIEERLRREAGVRQLNLQKEYLLEEIKEEHNFEQIVGGSGALSDVIEKVKLVAGTDASVLILGATGTGKEQPRALFGFSPSTPRHRPFRGDRRRRKRRLLARLRRGDQEAFEDAVHHFKGRVLAIARRLLRNEDDADDREWAG